MGRWVLAAGNGHEEALRAGVVLVGSRHMRSRTITALLLAAALSGCAYAGAELTGLDRGVDSVLGQTIIFVGTDSTTLETNIYQVQAVNLADSAAAGTGTDGAPAALDADEFEVTPLSDFLVGPGSPVQEDGDGILPTYAPFALPNRLGTSVAVIATGVDVDEVPIGRTAVLELGSRSMNLAPDVRGLVAVRFTWLGAHLIFETDDADTGPQLAFMGFPLDAETAPTPVAVAGAVAVEFAGLVPGTDTFLATAVQADGLTTVVAVDPGTAEIRVIVDGADGSFTGFALAPSGGLLSATRRAPDTGRRDIVVAAWADEDPEPTSWTVMTAELDSSCFDSAWSPAPLLDEDQRLAYVCEDANTGRPDLLLWEGAAIPSGSAPPDMAVLTGGAQTAVPDGSMDGLVVRSRLQWDPSGRIVVFGGSSADDAFNSEAMTLLAVDIGEQRAIPVYDGDNGTADLAHFSSAAPDPVLLVWDRSSSGVEDSAGRHAIQLVGADPSGSRAVRGVSLGQDLLVAYPLFLGGNSLFYP